MKRSADAPKGRGNKNFAQNKESMLPLSRGRLYIRLANEEDVAVNFAAENHQGADRTLEVIISGSNRHLVEHGLDFSFST
jgi:hypothetical protein